MVAVYEKSKELISYVRKSRCAAVLELKTYRTIGHSAFDRHPYRTKEEIEKWKKADPIKRIEDKIIEGGTSKKKIEDVKKKVDDVIEDAAKFALDSKYPEYDPAMQQ